MKKKTAPARMRWPMLWLLGIALVARILPATIHFVIGTDEGLFLTLAQNLAAGREYTGNGRIVQSDFPPGFPLFAAAIYRLGGDLELPSRLNTVLIGTLLPLPVFWLASRLAAAEGERADEQTGFRAGLFTALAPALVLGTANFEATAEPLYSLFLYTGWAVLWWGLTRPGVREGPPLNLSVGGLVPFLLAGLAVGAAHIVRWEGVILGLLGAGAIVVTLRQRAILPVVVFLVGLAAFATPYALFLQRNTGSYINPKTRITRLHAAALEAEKTDPFAFEKYYYDLEDVLADPVGLSHVPPALTQNNVPLAQRLVSNLILELRLLFTAPSVMTVVWILPALAGLWALRPRGRALFVVLLFLPLGAILASVVDPRYFLPPLPAAMILAAVGWKWIEGRWGHRRLGLFGRSLSIPSALIAATLALFVVFDVVGAFLLPRPTEYRSAGLALRGQIPAGAHMLARKRQMPFYAGAIWEWLPYGDLPEVLDYAAAHGAEYMVLDARTTLSLRPQLAPLLDPANAPDSLTAIYYDQQTGVVVYAIHPQP